MRGGGRVRPTTPYHPDEMGGQPPYPPPMIHTGLLGVLVVVATLLAAVLICVASLPLLLFGVVEVVSDGPTFWRVRRIRRPAAPGGAS